MAVFLIALVAFFVAAGGHFFLPLEHLPAAEGAEILLECSWTSHSEIVLVPLLLVLLPLCLRWKRMYLFTAFVGGLVVVQALTLQPLSFYLGESNPVLVLAERVAMRSHAGLKAWLAGWGLGIIALSAFGGLYRPRSVLHPSLSLLARRNLRRRVFRSATLITGVAISAGTIFAYTVLMQTVEKTLEIGAGRLGADIMVVPEGREGEAGRVLLSGEPSLFYMDQGIAGRVRETAGVAGVSAQVYFRPYSYKVCCSLEQMLIIGYDPATDFTVGPWVQYALGENRPAEGLVVGKLVKYYPGQTIELFARDVTVMASLDPTGLGYFDNAGFMSLGQVRALSRDVRAEEVTPLDREARDDMSFTHYFEGEAVEETMPLPKPDQISAVFVRVEDGVDPAVVAATLEKGIGGIDVLTVKGAARSARDSMTAVLRSLGGPIVVLWIMAAGLVAGAFSLIVNERRREIGILRAMGARRKSVAVVLILEALELTAMGGVLGLALGGSLALLFKGNILANLNLLYIWPPVFVIAGLAVAAVLLSLATGVLAGLYPAMKTARLEPYDSIRRGER